MTNGSQSWRSLPRHRPVDDETRALSLVPSCRSSSCRSQPAPRAPAFTLARGHDVKIPTQCSVFRVPCPVSEIWKMPRKRSKRSKPIALVAASRVALLFPRFSHQVTFPDSETAKVRRGTPLRLVSRPVSGDQGHAQLATHNSHILISTFTSIFHIRRLYLPVSHPFNLSRTG